MDSGHYFSDVFDVNIVIWCHCDNDEITQISNFTEVVYTRESHKQKYTKKKVMSGSNKVLSVVYIITSNLITPNSVSDKYFSYLSKRNHMK